MKNIAPIFILLVFLVSCNILDFGDGEVTTDLKIESNEISNIQDIEAVFTVSNKTRESITFEFSTGCQIGFKVLSKGTLIFNSEENQICTEALTSFTLKKNESKLLQIPHHFDNIKLESGDYNVRAFLIGYENEVNKSKKIKVTN